MRDIWKEKLFECAEGLYIVKEESKEIVWANDYLVRQMGTDGVGKTCWSVLLGRKEPCPFCPRLSETDDVYEWEHYEPVRKQWMKIKNLVFRHEGVLYRAGNVNMVNDMMRLNYEAVRELSELRKLCNETRSEIEDLTKEAIYDALTGLYNRNCFEHDLEELYKGVPQLGILYFDLNNLKEINDEYRHKAGDILLKRVGAVLRRISSHVKSARCYRIGGDEFVMLAKCGEQKLNHCAELFDVYLEAYNQGERYICAVAVGMAFAEHVTDPEMLVAKADKEMYRSKLGMKREMRQKETEE